MALAQVDEARTKLGVTTRDCEMMVQERNKEKKMNIILWPLSIAISLALGLGAGALWYLRPMGPTYPYCVGAATALSTISRPRLVIIWFVTFVVGFVISAYALTPYLFWQNHEEISTLGVEPYYGAFDRGSQSSITAHWR